MDGPIDKLPEMNKQWFADLIDELMFKAMCEPPKKGDIVEFADGHTIMLGPDGLYIMGVDCQHPYDSSTPWQIPLALPDDAKPVSATDITIQGIPIPTPGIVDGETPYERRKRQEGELAESNRKAHEEIRRILGQ